ncbi:MAG: serine/threonine protein kinase, partial [Caldilineae bacterium]
MEAEVGRDDLTIAYRARRASDGTPVLLKVVAPQFTFDAWFVRRFKDAVRRNIYLEHPHIIRTLEVGERDELLYMVQEWLDAEPLADYLSRNAPLPVTEVIALVKQIAAALDYAHSKAIRHGDLTGDNIFIRDGQVWLSDFGLTQTTEGTSLAKKGFAVGNPAYLAPERVRGESPSRPADLYALGVLTYQMLTGQLPFDGEPAAVLHAQVYEQPAPPHTLRPALRPAISDVVLRMLSKGLELRHTTGAEFARALQVAAEGSAPVRPI